MKKQIVQFGVDIKNVDKKNFTLDAVFSTANEDRHGDIVHQNWDLSHFEGNPVILNSHDYSDAAQVVGKAMSIGVVDGKLQGTIKFAVKENPKAKVIFDLYEGEFLSAFSVGFMPKEFDDSGAILKSELLEISAVSVPANAFALAKKKNIDVDLLKDNYDEDKPANEDEPTDPEDVNEDESSDGETESKCVHCKGAGAEDIESEPEVPEDTPTTPDSTEDEGTEPEDEPDGKVETGLKRVVKIADVIKRHARDIEKVETRSKNVRAQRRRLINKAIRDLTKTKKNL